MTKTNRLGLKKKCFCRRRKTSTIDDVGRYKLFQSVESAAWNVRSPTVAMSHCRYLQSHTCSVTKPRNDLMINIVSLKPNVFIRCSRWRLASVSVMWS